DRAAAPGAHPRAGARRARAIAAARHVGDRHDRHQERAGRSVVLARRCAAAVTAEAVVPVSATLMPWTLLWSSPRTRGPVRPSPGEVMRRSDLGTPLTDSSAYKQHRDYGPPPSRGQPAVGCRSAPNG